VKTVAQKEVDLNRQVLDSTSMSTHVMGKGRVSYLDRKFREANAPSISRITPSSEFITQGSINKDFEYSFLITLVLISIRHYFFILFAII